MVMMDGNLKPLVIKSLTSLTSRPSRGTAITGVVFALVAAVAFTPWWTTKAVLGALIVSGALIAVPLFAVWTSRRLQVATAYLEQMERPVSSYWQMRLLGFDFMAPAPESFVAIGVILGAAFASIVFLPEADRARGLTALAVVSAPAVFAWLSLWSLSRLFRVRWLLMVCALAPGQLKGWAFQRSLAYDVVPRDETAHA